MSLTKYTGAWTFEKAAHLLRRATFGPDKQRIEDAKAAGLDATIDLLFEDIPMPELPLNFSAQFDAATPVGVTWLGKPFDIVNSRGWGFSLAGWTIEQMRNSRTNIREKLVLFWHNHFAISDGNPDPRFLYEYITTLRRNAVGDFRQMTKDITVDPQMLRYLNGNENTVEAPNENYARELLELFTVGKGDIVGSGDYTTFTEQDVAAISKVLTGWKDVGFKNFIVNTVEGQYRNARHDKTTKTLSHRFDNAVINNEGAEEYETLIDIIFLSPHVAEFICRKLYIWFVYYEITEDIENEIIKPMAQILRDNDYNIKPALRALISSEHFFDDDRSGCIIKSPLDFIFSLTNSFGTEESPLLPVKYISNFVIYQFTSEIQMTLFALPSVAGWKAYYQGPGYYQTWINSVTLPQRKEASDGLGAVQFIPSPFTDAPLPLGIDAFAQLDKVSDRYDINKVVREIADVHLPKPLADEQYDLLKDTILFGLPDFEWSVEYSEFVADPEDEAKKIAIENKLRLFLITMMRMPEFQLM